MPYARLLSLGTFLTLVLAPVSTFAQDIEPSPDPVLEVSKPIERELKGGELHNYQIKVESQQFVNVAVDQRGVDVVVTLFDPRGRKISEVDSPNGSRGLEPLWCLTESSGSYKIEVRSLEKGAPAGRYEISLKELRPSTPDDKFFIAAKASIAEGQLLVSQRKEESTLKAIQKVDAATILYRQMVDKKARANGLMQTARIYRGLGKESEARAIFLETANLFEDVDSKRDAAISFLNAGQMSPGETDALNSFIKARDLTKAVGDSLLEVSALIEMGKCFWNMGDFTQAIESFQESLTISQEKNYQEKIAAALDNIGSAYTSQYNFVKALDAHQRSLALSQSLGLKNNIPGTLLNIGNVYEGQRNQQQALEYFQKALTEFEEMRAPVGIGYATSNIGNVYLDLGEYDKALEYFLKAKDQKAKFLKDDPYSFFNIGLVYKAQGKYKEALDSLQKCLEAAKGAEDISARADALQNIAGVYYAQGNYSKSLETVNEALQLAEQFNYPTIYVNALTVSAKVHMSLGQKKEAQQALESAVAKIENLRTQIVGNETEQKNFFESKMEPFELLVDLLVGEGNSEKAFLYAERARARALLDVLRNGKPDINKVISPEERDRERSLRNELASVNSQVFEAQSSESAKARLPELQTQLERKRLEFEGFQTALYAAHPGLNIQRGEMKPITLAEASTLLPDARTAILEYVVTNDKTFLFVLTKGIRPSTISLKVYPVAIKRKDLAEQVAGFRSKLAKVDLDFTTQARALYDQLVGLARSQIGDKTNLIIVPDGCLWDLPFQALQSTANRYLIENSTVAYAPSLTALREMVKKKPAQSVSPTLLAFGNPTVGKQTSDQVKQVFMDEKLDPLPEAERLVTSLQRMYGADRSKIYVGAEAREDLAKTEAPKYRIIQFAAHGILNDINPMYSHLVLAPGNAGSEDGLLEAWEITSLDLNSDLVILAACETARGRVGAGEGMIGMSWAFFVAGSPTTVASQWKVESASTTQLMLEFHRNLRGARMSKAKALQVAAISLLKKPEYRHPFYWAGFVLVGDGF
jgi:CHAT domain-containing protein/tetratricopeptide (TPR) repeat protein